MAVDPMLEQLLHGFVDEAQEICERITRDLLELEKGHRTPGAARAFEDLGRGLHTLKGSAATLGLDELAELAHRMEDATAPLRERAAIPTPVADALLRALDAWMSRLRATAADAELPDLQGAHSALEAARAELPALLAAERPPAEPRSPIISTAGPRSPPPVTSTAPAARSPSPLTTLAPSSPSPVHSSAGDTSITARRDEGGDGPDPKADAKIESWRVSTRQVSGLLHDVERLREVRLRLEERQRELARGLLQLARIGQELRKTGSTGAPVRITGGAETRAAFAGVARGLSADIDEASDIVASLEDELKAISTQPMRTILDPLRRAVRDLCQKAGKEVALSVVGGEVSLDRRVLESLRAPLVHLVRNAVDHGIELPQEREARGKHAEGALVVRVEQQGNMLFIEVADDGGGIDLARVRSTALERGFHTEAELAVMNPSRVQQIIFAPGFSTRASVSELSGRGIGLDIVRNQVLALNGQVEVQSVAGQGTRFILTLPVELGSSAVLVVRAGEHQVGIPTMAVESSRGARSSDVNVGKTQLRYAYREELIPLQDLGALLGLSKTQVPRDDQPLLILSSQGRRLALAVDEVLGDRELVIRPLPPEVRDLPAYQGAATLARGELILIVRPDWLASPELHQRTAIAPARRALVVDDSLTARAMHRSALEAGGFVVHTASSARQALEQLRRGNYDVLVADVKMEETDGYALTQMVRARAETADLPILLVSTLDAQAERRRAIAAGADAFLSKKDCAAGRLFTEVTAVLQRRSARS